MTKKSQIHMVWQLPLAILIVIAKLAGKVTGWCEGHYWARVRNKVMKDQDAHP